ncbi:MAG: putative McrBC restriction endonuclease system, McrB subunit [Bacteroidetes bacterium]|nr:putative McrBC restriction endonuclease system, McrB subunit [Bacteroidota bacterium]MBP1616578.1 putative McrBC restriction endonuclease system, McrB subunit [Bacteroidota bacterium]
MKDIYWHIQMFLPEGRDGIHIDSLKMLQEPQPVIGTGEWDDLQCKYFKNAVNGGLAIGDIVLVREGAKPLALCKVKSDSFISDELAEKYINQHYRYVDVLEFYTGKGSFPQPQGTLQKLINSYTDSWKFINNWYKQILDKMETTQIVDILRQKKQIILQGAPGTGKTYITASVVLSLIGEAYNPNDHKEIMTKYNKLVDDKRIFFATFHQSMDYEDFVEGLKPVVDNDNMIYEVKDGVFKKICTEAQSSTEVDIVQCIDKYLQSIKGYANKKTIPTISGKSQINVWWNEGNDTISVRSVMSQSAKSEDTTPSPLNIEKVKQQAIGEGVESNWRQYAEAFIRAVKEEYQIGTQIKDEPYILIIDEINRGNISKIFGELITLLEVDKRAGGEHPIKARLTYSNDDNFSVPSNLYIIGTMNTTDRSVGHIDYAIRRRFAFYTLIANKDAINSYYDIYKDAEHGLKELSMELFDLIYGYVDKHKSPEFDIEDLMVGHSYFMAMDKSSLMMKLQYEIIPLIKEYEKDGIITIAANERRSLGREWISLFGTNQ